VVRLHVTAIGGPARNRHCQRGAHDTFKIAGIEGAHEKGGVEGEVGRVHRTHLTPMSVIDSLAIDAIDDAEERGRSPARPQRSAKTSPFF
jgi:hypothetical protein